MRATQVLERRRNAFKHAGLAFRMWWLSLLGIISTWLAPIRGGSESFGKRLRQDLSSNLDGSRKKRGKISRLRNHGWPGAVLSRQPQSLEQRLLLTSDLTQVLTYSSLMLTAQDTLEIEIGGAMAGKATPQFPAKAGTATSNKDPLARKAVGTKGGDGVHGYE